jgi:hypothetical protein
LAIIEDLKQKNILSYQNYDLDIYKDYGKQNKIKSIPTILVVDVDGYEITRFEKESIELTEEFILNILNLEEVSKDIVIIEDVVASEDSEPFVFSDEDAKALPDADEANESHPDLDGAANGFVDVVLEAEDVVEVVLEAQDVVGVVLEAEDVVEAILESEKTTLKPKAVTDADNLILSFDFDEEPIVFDDEFSSEDLGNDTPDDVVDPEDLF